MERNHLAQSRICDAKIMGRLGLHEDDPGGLLGDVQRDGLAGGITQSQHRPARGITEAAPPHQHTREGQKARAQPEFPSNRIPLHGMTRLQRQQEPMNSRAIETDPIGDLGRAELRLLFSEAVEDIEGSDD